MKKRTHHFISFIAAALVIATACTNDVAEEYPPEAVSFTIDLSTGKLAARAVSDEAGDTDGSFNENKIDALDVFFYQGNTLKWRVNALSYDDAAQKATLPVTADKRDLFDGNSVYDIYAVANNTAALASIAENASNLQALKDVVLQTSDFVDWGGNTPQSSFVMDGMLSKAVSLNDPHLGTINMKRAAAKIRLRLIDVNVPGYTQEGDVTARLTHFTDQSALMEGGTPPALQEGDWKETGAQAVSTTYAAHRTTAAPFYAYANDWGETAANETYIELYVPLKHDDNGERYNYKYRVPVTPRGLTGDDRQYMNKIQRNFLYDIGVTVRILGSREEPPIEIGGDYIVKDWSTRELLVDITGAHYLVVSERSATMPNTSSHTLRFNSSIPNVTLVPGSLKATYTYINNDGETVKVNVDPDQQPTVTVAGGTAAGTISINSPIPVNYIPKDIEFQVTNGPLTETVAISQLSATYFTVTKGIASYLPDEGGRTSLPSGNNNPYMYAITTLAPSGDIIWGFPPTDSQGQTIDNEEVSKMVSPKFEMASQFGAVQRKNYEAGQRQCKGYTETAEDGTVKAGWRLPTAAEIHYIDVIQQTAPTEYVMRGAFYWSNWSAYPTQSGSNTRYGAYQMGVDIPAKNHNDNYNTGATYNSAHVRCIRDIKD